MQLKKDFLVEGFDRATLGRYLTGLHHVTLKWPLDSIFTRMFDLLMLLILSRWCFMVIVVWLANMLLDLPPLFVSCSLALFQRSSIVNLIREEHLLITDNNLDSCKLICDAGAIGEEKIVIAFCSTTHCRDLCLQLSFNCVLFWLHL